MTHVLTFVLAFWSGDGGVIDTALLRAIRRCHFRQHVPIREIERRTGLSRNTIREYLCSDETELKFKLPERPSKLDPFADKLMAWLRHGVGKSRKHKRTTKRSCPAAWCINQPGSVLSANQHFHQKKPKIIRVKYAKNRQNLR